MRQEEYDSAERCARCGYACLDDWKVIRGQQTFCSAECASDALFDQVAD